MKKNLFTVEGVIVKNLSNNNFQVKLKNNKIINAYISGKMRIFYIKILIGDTVTVELSPSDLTNGRIIYRKK